jgi:hypothetical protein
MERALQFGAKLSDAKDTAEELARSAGKKMEDLRSGTADVLRSAASTIRSTGRQSAAALDDFANSTANTLDAAGCYVKKQRMRAAANSFKNVPLNVRRTVRRFPGRSVLMAAAIGFVGAVAYFAFTRSNEQA